MIIRKMTASYGKLQNSSLELSPGLNIISAPNESGKSTWCSFIRSMLYGVDSSARERGGVKPDKTLFAPWNGAPMSGSMDIEHEGQKITLSRTGREAAPMRELTAAHTGTSQPIRDLSNAAGEALLGIPRDVFERSAFIGQGGVAVSASPELEKRIAAIVQTGDESTSYTDAEERLRAAMRKRRHNKSGALPEIEREQSVLRDRLSGIENEEIRRGQLKQALKQAIEKRDELTKTVAESREKQRKTTLDELGASRERMQSLENKLEELRTAAADAENELRSGRLYMQKPEDAHKKAARDMERLSELDAESGVQNLFKLRTFIAIISCAVLCVIGAFVNIYVCIALAFGAIVGVAGLIVIRKRLRKLKEQADEIFTSYGATDTSGVFDAVYKHEQLYARYTELCTEREAAQAQLEHERKRQAERDGDIVRGLDFTSADNSAAEHTQRLEEAEAALRRLREDLAAHEGRLEAMGGREALLEKIEALTKEHEKLTLEYEALALAADTLKEAGIEIQNRMTPRLSARASEIFSRLTGGRYEQVALDRELKAMARLSDDTLPRESAFFSAGALDQLYLAVRLAICELALPEGGKCCPLILDDALGSFDDNRCSAALSLLREMAASRQILLFTCHNREAEMMKQYSDVNIIRG